MTTYFLYARKSTDVEDKQVRSIEDQLAVLRALAKEQGLVIVEEFIEKQSAKMPGRPIFGEMLSRIQKGEAQGIVCWKLDRLARNPADGGTIQWMLQSGIIRHIQTYEKSYKTGDNTLLMSVEFGMANQFILDLAQNTKRGLHEKVKRGEYPSLAPIGYLNDRVKKTIVVDKATAKVIKAAFELYAEGNSRLEDISSFFAKHFIYSENGKPLKRDRITYILSNPFYVGLFRYAKELHEGKHQPLISKSLFDKVQAVLSSKSRPHHKLQNEPKPLCGLLKCAECGCAITAEEKIKHQKNGNVHRYVYYRCTKKKGACSQPHIREEELSRQLSEAIKPFALPHDLAAGMSRMADRDEAEAIQSSAAASQAMREEITAVSEKTKRLLATYLDGDIERENFLEEKVALLSRKKSLQEEMAGLQKGRIAWLEPLRGWIKDAETIEEIAVSPPLTPKKISAQKIFGSDLFLNSRSLVFTPTPPYASLREARQNFGENESCLKLEYLYGVVKTYFTRNF
jgi:DNA invertase Pin-like site-specific DNA recombinase